MERVRDIMKKPVTRGGVTHEQLEVSMDPLAHLSAELQTYNFSSDSEGNHAKRILGRE
jgi:hypothetical protein